MCGWTNPHSPVTQSETVKRAISTALARHSKTFHHGRLPAAGLIGPACSSTSASFKSLAILLVVPCYYFCTQSALHTEYRLRPCHSLFPFRAGPLLGIYTIACKLKQRLSRKRAGSGL